MKWSLAGLMLALAVTAFAQNPERWEKDIQAFEASDRTNRPPEGGVLFVGSSSIRLWTNLAQTFPDLRTVRRGFGGAYLSDVTALFDRLVLPYKPATIVLYAGENDIAGGRSPEAVFKAFEGFVDQMKEKLPGTRLYFLSMKPSPSRWHLSPQFSEGNAMIRRYAALHRNVEYVDVGKTLLNEQGRPDPAYFVKDQLHLNSKGYELWAKEIRRALGK